MAPKEDLNLPEGEQPEPKDTSAEGAETSAVVTEEEDMATAEINLVTEKGLANIPEASSSETQNIAAEISALLDTPEEKEEVFKTEDEMLAKSLVRKRITKGISEEETPGRRDSCFLTEIEEAADDEVFNAEDVVRNIASIDNFLLNQDKASEGKVGIQLENVEITDSNDVENIEIIEDKDNSNNEKEALDITEPSAMIAEKEVDEDYTPASIVDTILAKARASSVEDSKQEEEVELLLDTKEPEVQTKIESPTIQENEFVKIVNTEAEESTQAMSETSKDESHTESKIADSDVDSVPTEEEEVKLSLDPKEPEFQTKIDSQDTLENVDIQIVNSEAEQSPQAMPETSKDECDTESKITDSKIDSAPIELVQAANSIVDTILEKAKEVVIEKTLHLDEENVKEDVMLENPSVEVTFGTPEEEAILDNPPIEEELHINEEEEVSSERTPAEAVVDTSKSIILETPADEEILDLMKGDEEVETEIVEEIAVNKARELNEQSLELSEPISINEIQSSELIEDIVIAAEEKEQEECNNSSPVSAELASIENAELDIDRVVNKEELPKQDESLEDNKGLIENIKTEFIETFVEPENIDVRVTNSSEKLSNLFENFPLGELALATLVIFFALIIFN